MGRGRSLARLGLLRLILASLWAMNRVWMRERLERFKGLCETYNQENRASGYQWTARMDQINSQINAELPTAREIVKNLDAHLFAGINGPSYTVGASTDAVEQALGILRDQDEWKANLAPDAPSLIADQFHPNVWMAASAIWDTKQFRVAVQQAAVSLSAHIAAKAGSSLTERELVQLVFAPSVPATGQTRLHLTGDKTSKTWKSRQEGLHFLAQGVFAGIRNVATHTHDEWTEQTALEHLSVLSVVARWTDETELVKLDHASPRQQGMVHPRAVVDTRPSYYPPRLTRLPAPMPAGRPRWGACQRRRVDRSLTVRIVACTVSLA
jgi:hypothetical protein